MHLPLKFVSEKVLRLGKRRLGKDSERMKEKERATAAAAGKAIELSYDSFPFLIFYLRRPSSRFVLRSFFRVLLFLQIDCCLDLSRRVNFVACDEVELILVLSIYLGGEQLRCLSFFLSFFAGFASGHLSFSFSPLRSSNKSRIKRRIPPKVNKIDTLCTFPTLTFDII